MIKIVGNTFLARFTVRQGSLESISDFDPAFPVIDSH